MGIKNPIPSIYIISDDSTAETPPPSVLLSSTTPIRKPPIKRNFQEDEFKDFLTFLVCC